MDRGRKIGERCPLGSSLGGSALHHRSFRKRKRVKITGRQESKNKTREKLRNGVTGTWRLRGKRKGRNGGETIPSCRLFTAGVQNTSDHNGDSRTLQRSETGDRETTKSTSGLRHLRCHPNPEDRQHGLENSEEGDSLLRNLDVSDKLDEQT